MPHGLIFHGLVLHGLAEPTEVRQTRAPILRHGHLGALIVESDVATRRALRRLLAEAVDVRIVGVCASTLVALEMIRKRTPDVVFLGAELPNGSGFQLFSEVEPETRPAFVVVASTERHAGEAFKARAVDYITKPVDHPAVQRATDKARTHLLGWDSPFRARLGELLTAASEPRYLKRFVVRVGDKLRFVRADEVDWLEAANNYVRLHAGERRFLIRSTLKQLELQLDPSLFARIHRSAIVNIFRIAEVTRSASGGYLLTLVNGSELRVSRSYRDVVTGWRGRPGQQHSGPPDSDE